MKAPSIEEPFRFSPAANKIAAESDSIERQTRQEISRLVAEMGELSRSDIAPRLFWGEFLNRLLRGMAADAVVAWQMGTGVHELGRSGPLLLVDLTENELAGHDRLLLEVCAQHRPLLVPPHSLRDEGPGNPTTAWVAAVPVEPGDGEPVVVEIFLSDVGGPASQRGYLRFAAQMCDLAGEYLRASSLRRLKLTSRFWAQWEAALAKMMGATHAADVRRLTVDHAAECLGIERVCWLERSLQGWIVKASTGIDQLDTRSAAATWLSAQVRQQFRNPSTRNQSFIEGSIDNPTNLAVLSMTAVSWPQENHVSLRPRSTQGTINESFHQGIEATRRIADPFAVLVWQDADVEKWDSAKQVFAEAISRSAAGARRATQLADNLPIIGSWLSQRRPMANGSRSLVWSSVLLVAATLILLIPLPLRVTASATLEAIQRSGIQSPRNGTVEKLWVQHDQTVTTGTPLLQIVDPELDRLEEQVLGQRAVLEQRMIELQKSLVRGSETNRRAEWEGQRAECETEQASLDRQLEWLGQQRAALLICSPIAGNVEAWEARQNLEGRLVGRGEELLQIVNPSGGWRFKVEIPQNRLDHVLQAKTDRESLAVNVVLHAFPSQSIPGKLTMLGPTLSTGHNGTPFGWTEIEIDPQSLPLRQSGAAASVSISCGHRPLGFIVFQDLIRAIMGGWKLWIS